MTAQRTESHILANQSRTPSIQPPHGKAFAFQQPQKPGLAPEMQRAHGHDRIAFRKLSREISRSASLNELREP